MKNWREVVSPGCDGAPKWSILLSTPIYIFPQSLKLCNFFVRDGPQLSSPATTTLECDGQTPSRATKERGRKQGAQNEERETPVRFLWIILHNNKIFRIFLCLLCPHLPLNTEKQESRWAVRFHKFQQFAWSHYSFEVDIF